MPEAVRIRIGKTTKLILLDSLLQEVEATLPHLVLQKNKNDTEKRSNGDGVRERSKGELQGVDPRTDCQVRQDRP